MKKSIISWMGSKAKYIDKILKHFPKEINNYYEPFFGSGEVFLELMDVGIFQSHTIKEKAYLNDLNPLVINLFWCVRDDTEEFISKTLELRQHYWYTDKKEENFSKARDVLNAFLLSSNKQKSVEVAANFIYVMKTCFGGVFQISPKNQITSSFGNLPVKDRKIIEPDKVRECGSTFRKCEVEFFSKDFSEFDPKKGDFVYLDPPYYSGKSPNQYTPKRFKKEDQVRVRDYCVFLHNKGVKFCLNNSSHPFVLDLYKDFKILFLDERRDILKKKRTTEEKEKCILVCNI